ncbi:hypothetical protein FRC00_007210 [Tulasnella sp. 408]|nr:hypothetical protein FRC00_007210 [Tulasnella sp. 408]
MTEAIINNMREYRGCMIPEGACAVPALEITLVRGLESVFADTPDDIPSVVAFMALLAVYTTAFSLCDESSPATSLSSRIAVTVLEILPALAVWLLEDTMVEPMLTLRASFIAVIGAATQAESSYETMLSVLRTSLSLVVEVNNLDFRPIPRSELEAALYSYRALDIPYFVLFKTDYPFANEYEERILLQCASIMMKLPRPPGLKAQKYGGHNVAQGIRRILSSRLPLHAIVGERVLQHFYSSTDEHAPPWLEAGVHFGILDNIWRAKRLGLHSSKRVESDLPRAVFRGLLTIWWVEQRESSIQLKQNTFPLVS